MGSMIIGLASGSVEKSLVASTLTGGAVALDMDVDIYSAARRRLRLSQGRRRRRHLRGPA